MTQSCVDQCSANTYGVVSNYDCVETCPDGYYADSLTNLCKSTCTSNTTHILYFYAVNTSCLSSCP